MSYPAHTSTLYRHPPPAPWMVSSAPNSAPGCYHLHQRYERVPWGSDDTTKEHIRLKPDCLVQHTIVSTGRNTICAKLWTPFRRLFRSACGKEKRIRKNELDTLALPGNHVQVCNSTLRCSSSVTIDTGDIWQSLRHADDAQRPENGNWPVVDHATLRRRPPPYAAPRIDIQFPTPPFSSVRLNPYLEHHCNGPHPISFDITLRPENIMCASSSPSTTLDPATFFKQPAIHPRVRRMHIQCVAEDPLPHFPWPIEIENENAHGITCGDVLDAITNKFLEFVGEEEYHTWTPHRRRMAARAYHQRVQTMTDEGLRRIDYLGGKVVFHGLEQASVTTGDMWFMFVGACEKSGG